MEICACISVCIYTGHLAHYAVKSRCLHNDKRPVNSWINLSAVNCDKHVLMYAGQMHKLNIDLSFPCKYVFL